MTVDITVPALGESVTEATVMRWNKAPGDAVAVDETLVELETDKIAVEVKAEAAGTLAEIAAVEGTDVEVGALLGRLETGERAATAAAEPRVGEASDAPATVAARVTALETISARPTVPPPSPAVRRLLEEHGLDPAQIEGTGKGGRLLKSDVLAAVVARAASAATPTPGPDPESSPEAEAEAAPPAAPVPTRVTPAAAPVPAAVQPESAPSAAAHRREERVPMSRLRRRAGERLKLAQDTAAMLTTFNEVDMTAVTALRAAHGEAFEQKHGVRLGLMSFFVKATVAALVEYPTVNAQIDGDEIVYKRYQDIGVAVSAPRGLVVPVLRDAGRMSFAEVEQAIRAFGRQGPRRQARPRRPARRHLHHLQRRGLRLAHVHADHQPAAVRDPRHAQGAGAPGCGRGRGGNPPHDVSCAELRSPPHRRPRGGELPGPHQGLHRGPATHPA